MAATTENTETTESSERNVGRIEEIQGVVIEAVFPDKLPAINNAIVVEREVPESEDTDLSGGISGNLVCEVQQHLGDDRVRAVAMDTTDGLARGAEVIDDLTLEMNRARQAEITQEIMEVVAGAEALS